MGIVNRSKDVSEQYGSTFEMINASTTGKSDNVAWFPQAALIVSGKISAVGISGTPTEQLLIRRFVVGAGETAIPLGGAQTVIATGTSGPASYTFSLGLSTYVQAGDIIVCKHAGTNAGWEQVSVALVYQSIQDIRTWAL